MPLYEVEVEGTEKVRLVAAKTPAGAKKYVVEALKISAERADPRRIHQLAVAGIPIEGDQEEAAATTAQSDAFSEVDK